MVDGKLNVSIVGKNNQLFNNLKQHMDAMFSFASKVPYTKKHLLPVVQASKSLIGMSLDHPPRNLLKWLEQYVRQFQPDYQLPEYLSDGEKPDVLSIFHLLELIDSNKIKECRKYLMHLLSVADPQHIMELLLEISFQRSSSSTLFCWSACKTAHFMEDIMGILFICIDCLYESQQDENDMEDSLENFYLFCHTHHMIDKELVRSGKIIPSVMEKMNTLKNVVDINKHIPEGLASIIRKDGERGLVNYLSNLGLDEIYPDQVFLLDALRSAIRYGPDGIFDINTGKMADKC